MDIEEKLSTLADLEATLRSMNCRLTVVWQPDDNNWLAMISTSSGTFSVHEKHKDFATAVRMVCAKALARTFVN